MYTHEEFLAQERYPVSVFWFHNGMAAVCDQFGEQMPKFQGRHAVTLAAFKEAGIDWRTLAERNGSPNSE